MKKSKPRLPWAPVFGVVAIGLVVYACATPLVPEDVKLRPASMTAATPSARSATVGTTLQNEPAVVIRDQHGEPLPGVTVTFAASSGAAPSPATKQTDDAGRASPTTWALPTATGTVAMTASVAGTTLTAQTFTVTLTPGAPAAALVNPATPSSQDQSAVAGSPVAVAPAVRVNDQFGNAVPGVAVTFAATGGGGTVVPTTPVSTDAQGVARVTSWTLGSALGANTLRATVAGIAAPITFNATGTAGTPASVSVGGTGNSQGQTAIANTTVANAPIVLVRDANNNPVAGVTVRFTIGGGAGRILTGASDNTGQTTIDVTTNASGTASIFAWRLGSTGSNTLTAALPAHTAVTPFVFTATGIVGPPTQISVGNIAWAYTRASTVHGGTPSVLIRDAGGNAVSGLTVNWTTPDANSTLSGPASSTSSATGVAAFPRASVNWTASATVGQTMSLVATVSGTSLTQNFTSKIVGAPTAITIEAGNNQSASVNTAVAVKPAVKVVDATGDPVPGASVSFAVTGGGGAVSGTPALADSVGVSTVGNWTMGASIGVTNTMRATLTGLTPFVDFSATPTAGPPASITPKPGNPTTGAVNSSQVVTVIVRDAGANPVQGASVTFTPNNTPGNAAVTGSPATTDANGEATVTWRLDTLARTNTLVAGVTGITGNQLSITGTPLAATKIVVSTGNNQTGTPSTVLGTQPQVKVSDVYNNAVAAISVTWAPAAGNGQVNCGGGNVASCTSTSNSAGIAATTWTLGPASGTHTLQSSLTADGTKNVSFTATTADPCAQSTTITPGSTYNGSLTTADCSVSSYYLDKYTHIVPASTTRQMAFTYSTGAFNPYFLARLWTGAGWQSSLGTTGSVTQNYVLGPGTYNFEASSNTTNQTGAYSLVTTLNPAIPAGCANFLVTKGITVAHALDVNCNFTSASQTGTASSKAYWIFLPANTGATVRMNAGTLADPYLECWDGTTSTVTPTFVTGCFNDDGGGSGNSLLTIPTAGTGRYILIRATHYNSSGTVAPQTGTYTLIIDP